MRLIEKAYLHFPYYGSRQMARHLRRLRHAVGRRRVRRLMAKMGLAEIYQKPRASAPNREHRIYPCLLRELVIARARVVAGNLLRPGPGPSPDSMAGQHKNLIFLDPPYEQGLVQRSLNVLRAEGWLGPGSVVVAETGRLQPVAEAGSILAHRVHGAAQITFWWE